MAATESAKVIGGRQNFWLHTEEEGFDMTHPASPDSTPILPRLKLQTTKEPATIDPAKTALVVVDLQNCFLSPLLGRPPESLGLRVTDQLVQKAIPACRRAGIPIVWLGWGLSDDDLDILPPTIIRDFSLDTNFDNSTGCINSRGPDWQCRCRLVLNMMN